MASESWKHLAKLPENWVENAAVPLAAQPLERHVAQPSEQPLVNELASLVCKSRSLCILQSIEPLAQLAVELAAGRGSSWSSLR